MINKQCKHSREELVLHFYEETDPAKAAQMSARLELCPSCREYFASLKAVESVLPRKPSVDPDAAVMSAIRAATDARIAEISLKKKGTIFVSNGRFTRQVYRRFSLVAIAVFAAFMVGRISAPTRALIGNNNPDPMLSTISDVQYDKESGLVNVHFRTEEYSVVSGSVDDADIQLMLGMALANASNPSARLRATKLLSQIDLDPVSPNPKFVGALEHILAEESNVGIQLQAVKALRRVHGSRELPESLSFILMELLETSSNSALRMEILELLTQSELARQELQRILERAATDENSFIRHKARTHLDELDGAVRLEELN